MENSISEEESGSDKDSAPESGEAKVASEDEVPQSLFKEVLPWIAIGVFAIVTVIFTWAATPLKYYIDHLEPMLAIELDSLPRFERLIFSLGWFALFFALLKKLPLWARGIIFAAFFLPSAFSVYLQKFYGMELNLAFAIDCLNTHWQEACGFISFHAIATLLGFIALMFAVAWLIGKVPAKLPRSKIFTSALVAVLVFSLVPEISRVGIAPVGVVYDVGHWLYVYETDRKPKLEQLAKQESEPQEVERVPAEISHVNAVPVVVLHIGESARADHAPFNGYARNTMPNMLREYEAGNLILFPKCVSFSTSTPLSMRGIMSPSTVLDNAFRHSTFIPVLNQSGVETCAFCSWFQPKSKIADVAIGQFLVNMRDLISTNELAPSLLPRIREKLAEDAEKTPPQERFYLYWGEGSHMPFTFYDYDRHAIFKPNGKRMYADERDVNNYDNTFIAVDEFCEGFIDALRNENAVYIFVGDHGNMLGEDGLQGRPYRRPESRHVLFFIWASDKFKAENPELWATLLRNRKQLGIISHDFVYNSVLHLFSLKTPFYDGKADLFSDSAEPFPTEMPEAEEFGPMRFDENTSFYMKIFEE